MLNVKSMSESGQEVVNEIDIDAAIEQNLKAELNYEMLKKFACMVDDDYKDAMIKVFPDFSEDTNYLISPKKVTH